MLHKKDGREKKKNDTEGRHITYEGRVNEARCEHQEARAKKFEKNALSSLSPAKPRTKKKKNRGEPAQFSGK